MFFRTDWLLLTNAKILSITVTSHITPMTTATKRAIKRGDEMNCMLQIALGNHIFQCSPMEKKSPAGRELAL